MASVTYNNIKVDFDPDPRVTFLQGCDMDVFTIQDNIRWIENSQTGCMSEFKMVIKAWGNENFSADGSQKDALSIMILEPYVIDFELGAIPFSTSRGNLLGTFAQQSVMVNNAIGAVSLNSEAIEYSSYGGGVSLDINATINATGQVYPTGNQEFPCNNLADTIAIANSRGFSKIFIKSSMLGADAINGGSDLRNFTLIGESDIRTQIDIEASAMVENITVQECHVIGTLDGGTQLKDCTVGNLDYVHGHLHDCGLVGTIVLAGNMNAIFSDCFSPDYDNEPVIDMGVLGQNLTMIDYSGVISIRNLSSASEEIGIGLTTGRVTLEPTISAGTVLLGGTGLIINNSTGTTIVNQEALINKELIVRATWTSVYLDESTGIAGTGSLVGSAQSPSNNLADAILIADAHNLSTIMVSGSITLTQNVSSKEFISWKNGKIAMNNQMCLATRFREAKLSGIQGSVALVFDCRITNLQSMVGVYTDCRFLDSTPLVLAQGETHIFNSKSQTKNKVVFDLSAGTEANPITLLLKDWVGKIEIKNSTSSTNHVDVHTSAGHITLTGNTLGMIDLEGVYELTDDNSGATIESAARLLVEENAGEVIWSYDRDA